MLLENTDEGAILHKVGPLSLRSKPTEDTRDNLALVSLQNEDHPLAFSGRHFPPCALCDVFFCTTLPE